MSGISTITQAQGFDQQRYEAFIQQAKAAKADAGVVDTLLLSAVNRGKTFDQALAEVSRDLPRLTSPTGAAMALLGDWPGLPSPGALIMSITTEYAAEQRQRNQELMWQETEAIAESMRNQANVMRSTAGTQLAIGIASGALQIGVGVAQTAIGFGAGARAAKAAGAARAGAADAADGGEAAASQALNNSIMKSNMASSAVGQMAGGVTGMLGAWRDYAGTMMQARLKEMEADQETMRAVRDSVKNLDEALRALIQKALAAQNDIAASTNQARTKILA